MKHSVLVVDDDSDDRHFIHEAFRLSNLDVELVEFSNANNIVGALKNLEKENPISLIFLDLNLPGKNGFDALRELKEDEDCTHIPTVVLTTSSSERDRNESYAMGASCFLSKPNSFEMYMKMLTSVFKLYIQPGIS